MKVERTELGELWKLPSGTKVLYRDEDHSYWRVKPDGARGKRYTGVTTAVKPVDFEADRLMNWAARTQTVGIARMVDAALGLPDADAIRADLRWLDAEDPERIWQALTDEGLTYDDLRAEKARRGTNVHEIVLRALAEGEPVPDFERLEPDEKGAAQAVVDFWLDHRPKPLQVEQVVADPDLGIAGRFDLRARLHACGDEHCPCQAGGVGLIDLKTGTWTSEKDHCQLAAYALLAERSGFGASDWLGILHVGEGGYSMLPVRATEEDALGAIAVYRARARIRSAAGKDRKARRT